MRRSSILIVAALAGLLAEPLLAQVSNVQQGIPEASQLETSDRVHSVNPARSLIRIGRTTFKVSQNTRVYIDGRPVLGISKVRPGDDAAYQVGRDGSLAFLIVNSAN